jgi:hypothetical protein
MPYSEAVYNEWLSPRIPRALGRELYLYGEHLDRGAQAATRGGARFEWGGGQYRARYDDIPSVQLGLRLGWTLPPEVAARILQQARPVNPTKRPGLRLPRLPWQKG